MVNKRVVDCFYCCHQWRKRNIAWWQHCSAENKYFKMWRKKSAK